MEFKKDEALLNTPLRNYIEKDEEFKKIDQGSHSIQVNLNQDKRFNRESFEMSNHIQNARELA